MAGLGDIATTLLTGGTPAQHIADYLAGRGGPQGGQGGAPGAPGPLPGQGPPAGPQMGPAQATQSPPDLVALYAQLQKQQMGADMINQGVAGLAAANAPPGQAGVMANAFRAQPQDAGAMIQNLMQFQQYQRMQQAIPGLIDSGAIPKEWGPVLAANPELIQTAMQANLPTGEYHNYLIAEKAFIHENSDGTPAGNAAAKATFERNNPLINAIGGGGTADMKNFLQDKAAHEADPNNKGVPYPYSSPSDRVLGMAQERIEGKQKQTAQDQASKDYPAYAGPNGTLMDIRSKAAELTDPANKTDIEKLSGMISTAGVSKPGLGTTFRQGLEAAGLWGGMTDNQIKLVRDMEDLSKYAKDAITRSHPNQPQDTGIIGENIARIGQFDLGAQGTIDYAKTLINNVDIARANALGASGQLDRLEEEALRTAGASPEEQAKAKAFFESGVDSSFLPEGSNFVGKGKTLDPETIAKAKAAIAKGAPPAAVIRHYQVMGYRTRQLELELGRGG